MSQSMEALNFMELRKLHYKQIKAKMHELDEQRCKIFDEFTPLKTLHIKKIDQGHFYWGFCCCNLAFHDVTNQEAIFETFEMNVYEIYDVMTNRFNAKFDDIWKRYEFKNEKIGEEALDWLVSYITMNKLEGAK